LGPGESIRADPVGSAPMSAKAGIEVPVSRAEGDYERFERATEGI
jgi:hypothetical protein